MHSSPTQVVQTTTSRKQILNLRALLRWHSWCDEVSDVPLKGPEGVRGKWGMQQCNSAASTCVKLTLAAAEQIYCKSIFQVHSHRGAVIADGALLHGIPHLTGGGSIATYRHAAAS